jgi:hypothetical protein
LTAENPSFVWYETRVAGRSTELLNYEWSELLGAGQRGTGCGLERSLNIPLTDNAVFETVVQLHKESSILKEEVKKRVYGQYGIKQVKTAEQLNELQRQVSQLERRLNDLQKPKGILQARHLMEELDEVAFKAARGQVEDAENRLQIELSNVKLNLRDEGEKKQLVDWVSMFGKEVDGKKSLAKEQRQAYLAGLIESIDAKFDAKSRDHELTLHFHHPIVGDSIRWRDPEKKSLGYSISEGSALTKLRVKKRDKRGC